MFMKYRLKYGESLNDVANLFNTNKEYLKEINNIYFDDMVREGMDIVVPKNSENYYNTYIIVFLLLYIYYYNTFCLKNQ